MKQTFLKKLARWIFGIDYWIEEWKQQHETKLAELQNTMEHIALRRLGYRVKSNLIAKEYVEGQLPDAPIDSLYTLERITPTINK